MSARAASLFITSGSGWLFGRRFQLSKRLPLPLKRFVFPHRERRPLASAWIASVAFVVCAAFADAGAAPLVSKVEGDRRPVEIVSTALTASETEAAVTFRSAFGIFAFNLDLTGTKLTKLTLVIEKQRFCEGLGFSTEGGGVIDLLHGEGVTISAQGGSLAIEFAGPSLAALKAAGPGKIQYVNQYR